MDPGFYYPRNPGSWDPEILKTQDIRILGFQDPDILGFLIPVYSGFKNPRISGSQDPRILISQVFRISGSQDPGILGSWVHELKESLCLSHFLEVSTSGSALTETKTTKNTEQRTENCKIQFQNHFLSVPDRLALFRPQSLGVKLQIRFETLPALKRLIKE